MFSATVTRKSGFLSRERIASKICDHDQRSHLNADCVCSSLAGERRRWLFCKVKSTLSEQEVGRPKRSAFNRTHGL